MSQNNGNHKEEGGHHIVPFSVLRNVCGALLVFTALTVIAARMHLGALAAPVAFTIALCKALLVMAFFMGLKYDVRSNRLIFATGFFFLFVLWFFTYLDIFTRIFQASTL